MRPDTARHRDSTMFVPAVSLSRPLLLARPADHRSTRRHDAYNGPTPLIADTDTES